MSKKHHIAIIDNVANKNVKYVKAEDVIIKGDYTLGDLLDDVSKLKVKVDNQATALKAANEAIKLLNSRLNVLKEEILK